MFFNPTFSVFLANAYGTRDVFKCFLNSDTTYASMNINLCDGEDGGINITTSGNVIASGDTILLLTIMISNSTTTTRIGTTTSITIASMNRIQRLNTFTCIEIFGLCVITSFGIITSGNIKARVGMQAYNGIIFGLTIVTMSRLRVIIIASFCVDRTNIESSFTILTSFDYAFRPNMKVSGNVTTSFCTYFSRNTNEVRGNCTYVRRLVRGTLTRGTFDGKGLLTKISTRGRVTINDKGATGLNAYFIRLLRCINRMVFTLHVIINRNDRRIGRLQTFRTMGANISFLSDFLVFNDVLLLCSTLCVTINVTCGTTMTRQIIRGYHGCNDDDTTFLVYFTRFFRLFTIRRQDIATRSRHDTIRILRNVNDLRCDITNTGLLNLRNGDSLVTCRYFCRLYFVTCSGGLFIYTNDTYDIGCILRRKLTTCLIRCLKMFTTRSYTFTYNRSCYCWF